MKKAACIAGLFLVATAAVAGDGAIRRTTRHIPGRYVAVLDATASVSGVAAAVRGNHNARVHKSLEHGIKALSLEMSDVDAQQLARDPRVLFVEEDAVVGTASTTWGLDRIDQRTLPLDGSYIPNGIGAGISVYIVDTGIMAAHNDFAGRVANGFSAFDDGYGSGDCNGHGTHVAGIAAGSEFGVAKGATLVPVRVLDCNGSGSISTLLAGLDWIVSDHQQSGTPAVINMSLSGFGSSALDAQVNSLLTGGMTVVAAAGNNADSACNYSPARVPGVLTVGATTAADKRASYSNFGPCVDLFAPGQAIVSDWYTDPTATSADSGTSMAAPFVAGVAALCLERYPNASPADVAQTIVTQASPVVDISGLVDGTPVLLLYSSIAELDSGVAQLLNDPGFDSGTTFWTSTVCDPSNPSGCFPGDMYEAMAQNLPSHSGKTHMSFGGKAPSAVLTSEVVTIPAGVGRAELSFYLWVYTKANKQKADSFFKAVIRDANGAVLETLGTYSNLDASSGYVYRKFDMTKYRGKAIRISFESATDNGPTTWFILDDAAVRVWR